MASFMKRLTGETYVALRIIVGLLFLCHGLQKLFGYPMPLPAGAPPMLLWAAGTIELVGGTLVALGLFTRWAAFVCSGQMAVAYWIAHGTKHLFPLVNGGELAVLYCFAFLYLSAHGAGGLSLDRLRGRGA